MAKRKIPQQQTRKASFSGAQVNAEQRVLRAALSSSEPVTQAFGVEVLEHSERAINLKRAGENGLPLLANHDSRSLPIGRVRNIALESDGVLRGDFHFSEATEAAREAWALAQEGTLSDVSIGYRIDSYQPRGKGDARHVHVDHWTLNEASVVSVPADATVGIGRQLHEDTEMADDNTETPVPVSDPTPVLPSASRAAGAAEGARAERQRMNDIENLAANFPGNATVADVATAARANGDSVDQFRQSLILALAGEPAQPLSQPISAPGTVSIAPGSDGGERTARGIVEALNLRAGNLRGEAVERARGNEFNGLSLVEIARRCLESSGVSTRGWSPMQVAEQSLVRAIDPGTANLTTASFPAILENVMNKSLFNGFNEAPVTWNRFCGTGSSRDFKAGTRPGVSQFTSLAKVAENAQVQDGIVTDKKEAFQVETWARKFSVTRQTLVNDDLAGLSDVASKMGGAAARTVDEQVYAFIEANAAMTEDGFPLFDETNHNNAPAALGDPSTANISTARVRLGKMTDWNGVILGIVPQYMLCPIELEEAMLVMRSSVTGLDPDATNVTRDNVYRQMWEPISTPRLTDANDWYMFGARGEHIDVIFLNDQQSPMMSRDEGWSVLAAHWRVVLDFDVMAVDWRSAIKFTNV